MGCVYRESPGGAALLGSLDLLEEQQRKWNCPGRADAGDPAAQ